MKQDIIQFAEIQRIKRAAHLLCLLLLVPSRIFSETTGVDQPDTSARGFHVGGGMFYYLGYAIADVNYRELRGLTRGLGGRLYVPVGRLFAAGAGGGSVTRSYGSARNRTSYLSAGYGGVTAEVRLSVSEKSCIAPGLLAGGGRVENLHIIELSGPDTISAVYTQFGAAAFGPFVSLEHNLTKAIRLVVVIDGLFMLSRKSDFFLRLPHIRAGINFLR